ncbi:hypothetical protein [uncultured Turicimonas sp.]|nr:hypothetical protein [uncultured Turicimonas sp.]
MKGIEEIIAERSKAEGKAEIAKNLFMLGIGSLEGISKSTGLS